MGSGPDEVANRRTTSRGARQPAPRVAPDLVGLPDLPVHPEFADALIDVPEPASLVMSDLEEIAVARTLAARDRAAAARDREAAALDRYRAAEYLRRIYRDSLTGALHREAGRDQLQHEVERAHRSGDALVVAFLDVDGMKKVNDEEGHAAGDALLRSVGSTLLNCLRSYDVVVRYGGDEFVCALPKTRLADARKRFNRVVEVLSNARPGFSVSFGLALLQPNESLEQVVERADRQLYETRRSRRDGRDRRDNANGDG
jgi:diguanylate cyclase (GGDEF)-like protein